MSDVPTGGRDGGLSHSALVEWAVRGLTLLSSLALIVLLLATFVGVIMRYFLSAPILGSNEIIQLGSVALVMLAMPAAAQREAHVRVDVLDGAIGPWGRFIGDIIARVLGMFLLGVLAWRAWDKAFDAFEYGDVTNMISIPFWPFYGLMALSAVLYVVVLTLQLLDIVRAGARAND
ncbi:TRAP transporter small permease [Pelagibacterium halotolerans]|uniref:TRAP transporter small permease n=1 Tax=Pelagibacterium halotolerans TaxID=531813 RepID=UPI0002FD2667|nr:TRAP transporter small permease [Pelagibacterium halotolerans]QJR18135.1 TRAP transporter small permease [Pelagibacterium halotolerans]SDZ83336.1 TRAP-type C4-dicarboxylate transport system, small permease component [Pelagibacterium halotolerans]